LVSDLLQRLETPNQEALGKGGVKQVLADYCAKLYTLCLPGAG
jgi:hypothetical protein